MWYKQNIEGINLCQYFPSMPCDHLLYILYSKSILSIITLVVVSQVYYVDKRDWRISAYLI